MNPKWKLLNQPNSNWNNFFSISSIHIVGHIFFPVEGYGFTLGGGLDFVIPKTSSVSSKANTADSRAGRKKENKEQIHSSATHGNLEE